MLTARTWQPARPMPTLRTWKPAQPAIPRGLAAALEEDDTIIVLVIGAGPESDRAERVCRGLALDPGFEAVRVVRVRERGEQRGAQRAYGLAGNCSLAVLGPDRRLAVPLARADAVDLFVAVAAMA